MLRCKRLSETAILPVRGSVFAAGYDLASAVDIIVPAKGKAIVKTDLAIAIPENTYARIAPRSGLAVKNFIDVGAGVVDYDYRGNVGVVLFNHSDIDFIVRQSDRIAQLILEKIAMVPVEEVSELPSTDRGEGGFGSTGTESHSTSTGGGSGTEENNNNNNNSVKRIKLDESCTSLDDLMLFIHTVASEIGEDRKVKLKTLVLNGGDHKVRALMAEFTATGSQVSELIQSIDLIA